MYEVEIKVPAELAAVRERLRQVDAERVETRRQRDVYYDAPHREFAETDEALRVRHETVRPDGAGSVPDGENPDDETARLTYKGPLLDDESKTRSEHEAGVDDPDAMAEILDGLGFEPAATVVKRREYWAFREFTVALDDVDGVGEFIEIEREIREADAIDATREAAVESLSRLGLDADEQVRTSYLGLLLADD